MDWGVSVTTDKLTGGVLMLSKRDSPRRQTDRKVRSSCFEGMKAYLVESSERRSLSRFLCDNEMEARKGL
ncbi:MAG: hypothetical protein EA380_05030 [Phycisphaeraceae bacterium]|nr:MAG: hypothetical protein EA380_05030 [Phycisphaeraceae bacterium]